MTDLSLMNANTPIKKGVKIPNTSAPKHANSKFFENLLSTNVGFPVLEPAKLTEFSENVVDMLATDYVGDVSKKDLKLEPKIKIEKPTENIELYDQRNYAIGKLSYLKREVKSIISDIAVVEVKPQSPVNSEARDRNSMGMSAVANKYDIASNNHSLNAIKTNYEKIDSKGDSLTSVRAVVFGKYEREKITEISRKGKTNIYIRDYFTSTDRLNELASQYLLKFKSAVKLIINGKRSN